MAIYIAISYSCKNRDEEFLCMDLLDILEDSEYRPVSLVCTRCSSCFRTNVSASGFILYKWSPFSVSPDSLCFSAESSSAFNKCLWSKQLARHAQIWRRLSRKQLISDQWCAIARIIGHLSVAFGSWAPPLRIWACLASRKTGSRRLLKRKPTNSRREKHRKSMYFRLLSVGRTWGPWGALRGLLPQDKSGNATVGADVRLYESKNCIVHTSEEKRSLFVVLLRYLKADHIHKLFVYLCRNMKCYINSRDTYFSINYFSFFAAFVLGSLAWFSGLLVDWEFH